nr:retrovirus-related Pol polyprotein from transposon TNT 1-94 [Tanacetum cinerariifolium]
MSTQQDIYATGSENHPPMLNKENYVPWSSRLLRYAKSRPNGKLIHNSIMSGPYVRRMIPEPGDINREVPVNETFHVHIDDELTGKEIKQIDADDQAIQTILLGLPEDIYAAVYSCETAQEIWLRKEVDELKAERLVKTQDPLALMATSNNPYAFPAPHQDQPSFNQNYMQQLIPNPKDITDPITAINMTLALIAKAFKLNYSTPTNNNQRISSNPRNRQIAQPECREFEQVQNVRNQVAQNTIQNPRVQNVRNQNGLMGVPGNANQNRNGNLVKEEARIQLQAEEFDLMVAAADLDEIKEVNANCILMAHLQQASTSGTQTDKAPIYDSDGSAEKKQQNLYDGKVLLEKHDPPVVHDSEKTLQLAQENDTTPSVALKFLNEVKSTIVTLQCVVKHRMTLETHNWSSSAHQELHKIVKDEKFPIVNQVDAREQNFEIQFLKEAAKFIRDFKSLAKEADESLAKHKALELEIERLLRAAVSQDIMSVVKKAFVDTSNLQTKLERTKERFENCIIKKENEYAKLWNDWYKKCEECKFDKISYDKAYNDMQQKIERLQAQLGDLKGKSKDTSCVSDTLNPLSQKLENENDNTRGTSTNTKFAKQSILGNPSKVGEIHALSNPVTLNSVPTPQESKVMKNDKVIAQGMFMINPFKTSREEKHVPNTIRASARTKSITVSQPHVFTKKDVNSNSNGLSSTGIDNTKTKRPQTRSNTKNDRILYASMSSCNKNKRVEVEEDHRNLLLSKNKKHMSSVCNNIKLDSQNIISKVVYAMCKQCLISVNHDVFFRNYVNGKTSLSKKQKVNVSIKEKQNKQQLKVKKTKKVGFIERLATPKPSKPRFFLRWSPTGRLFDLKGKIIAFSEPKSQSDCSNGDNACTSNTLEPKIKRFLNSNSLLGRNLEGVDLLKGNRTTNLYTINLHDMASASPICLMARASSTKSWLWYQRLSHLNFDTINDLAKNDLVLGLPKFKYHKEHLFPSCEQGKSKRASNPPKPIPNSRQRLHLLHMDLCGPMRIASIMESENHISPSFMYSGICVIPRMIVKILGSLVQSVTSGQISSGLALTYAPSTITTQQPTEGELNLLFEAMYDDFIGGQPSAD